MKLTPIKNDPVAKLYAKALYELANEQSSVTGVEKSLADFLTIYRENPELRKALSSHMFDIESKKNLIAELSVKLSLNNSIKKLLELLVLKNRITSIELIVTFFHFFIDQSAGVVRGSLTSFDALSESEVNEISQAFAKKLNKKIILEQAVDKNILGGLIVKVKGQTFDGSLLTAIRRLRENLERQSI